MIAHIISINTVFQEQLPVKFGSTRSTRFSQLFSSLHSWKPVMLEINNPRTSMGQTAPDGVKLPEWRSIGWAMGTQSQGPGFYCCA